MWLANRPFEEKDRGGSGTWLAALGNALVETQAVTLGAIAFAPVSQVQRRDCGPIQQWLVPPQPAGRDGLPLRQTVRGIVEACREFAPDVVHAWGTETYWGLLTARRILDYPAILEMQGLKTAIARVFAGGLSWRQRMACIGPREILKRRTIMHDAAEYAAWGRFESEMLRGHRYISVQTSWLAAQVLAINPAAQLFHTEFALNEVFSKTTWRPSHPPTVFCSSAYPAPFKGLHVALRAFALVLPRFSEARLRIAGGLQGHGLRQNGYVRWLNRLANGLGIANNVDWLGSVSAERIAQELAGASAMLMPSFVEGYCLALAEAMRVGTPAVVSFAGGAACIAKDEETCLYFSPGDHAMGAFQLERVLRDRDLAARLSTTGRQVAAVRNDSQQIVARQLEIYRQVIADAPQGP